MAAIGKRHTQLQAHEGVNRQTGVDLIEEIFKARSRGGGNKDSLVAMTIGADHCCKIVRGKQVCFIQDVQAWSILNAKIGEHFHHFDIMLRVMGIGNIGDVENECGFLYFLKSGAESGD